jgi:hypothetical protein
VTGPDPRTLAGTDYAGTPFPSLAPANYRWVTGLQWKSSLELNELKGDVSLAVRVHFLFFHHTFKQKLFGWPGLHQSFELVSGGTGEAIAYADDYGKQADSVAYTPITPITDAAPIVKPVGTNFPYCFDPPK